MPPQPPASIADVIAFHRSLATEGFDDRPADWHARAAAVLDQFAANAGLPEPTGIPVQIDVAHGPNDVRPATMALMPFVPTPGEAIEIDGQLFAIAGRMTVIRDGAVRACIVIQAARKDTGIVRAKPGDLNGLKLS